MKTITLKQVGYGRYDDVSPFPLGALELLLEGIPSYSGEFRFVAACNGVECRLQRVTASQNRVNISADKLTAGWFTSEIQHYSGGVLAKRFLIEPLRIIETEDAAKADPFFGQTEEKLAALENSIEELKEQATNAETRAEAAESKLQELEARLSVLEANNDIFNA